MQSTSYFSGCYPRQDLNGITNGGLWPTYTNNLISNMSGQSYNSLCLPQNLDQIRVFYHNEVVRQMMLRHENMFREQVQELHRLYRRQRELMDEFKRRGIKEPNIVPMSHYNPIMAKVSSDFAPMTWQTPTGLTLPWINSAANNLSISGFKNLLSAFGLLETSPQNKNSFENNELMPPNCKKPTLKMLDLELPADNYVEREGEIGNEVQMNSFPCSNGKNVNMTAFDLNMPPTLSLELDILQPNREIENGANSDHDSPKKVRKEFLISQVSPLPHGVESKASTKYLIDLNYCVDEDEPLPTLPISKTTSEIDMEPVSPENKESSPPRGDSEENLLECRVQLSKKDNSECNDDLVRVAAETILLMSKSSFNEKSLESHVESLDWFASIVVSSILNKLEVYEAGISSDEREKEEAKCVVALPSQQRKRHRERRNKKISKKGDFRSLSSLMNYTLDYGEKRLKSWGKVNKRLRGPRLPACSIRLLWS